MRRRRFMTPAVVAMLFVNTIIQNAPAEQTVETEAQEKEVKVNSQTTQAAQSLEEAKANLQAAGILFLRRVFRLRDIKQERKEIENRFWKKSRQPKTDVKKPPEKNSGGGQSN